MFTYRIELCIAGGAWRPVNDCTGTHVRPKVFANATEAWTTADALSARATERGYCTMEVRVVTYEGDKRVRTMAPQDRNAPDPTLPALIELSPTLNEKMRRQGYKFRADNDDRKTSIYFREPPSEMEAVAAFRERGVEPGNFVVNPI